jgi:outer membrane protein OmpA-like peptidoglycan-associated protein
MKNRAVVALFIAFLLALPALAQQPAASTTPDNSSSTASGNATGKAPLTVETHEGFWGKVNPFARKKYVQRQTQPIRDRVNELDELTAANTKMIKDTDSRAQAGIQMASAKASEADQHAVDAGNQYKATNQTEIRFRPGQNILSADAKGAIDQLAEPLKGQRGYIVEVQGFSSGKGQAAIATSRRMADAVVRYLVENHEIPVYRIYVLGMGNAPLPTSTDEQGAKPKRMSGGRVEISLMKNDLEQLASSSTAPAATEQK